MNYDESWLSHRILFGSSVVRVMRLKTYEIKIEKIEVKKVRQYDVVWTGRGKCENRLLDDMWDIRCHRRRVAHTIYLKWHFYTMRDDERALDQVLNFVPFRTHPKPEAENTYTHTAHTTHVTYRTMDGLSVIYMKWLICKNISHGKNEKQKQAPPPDKKWTTKTNRYCSMLVSCWCCQCCCCCRLCWCKIKKNHFGRENGLCVWSCACGCLCVRLCGMRVCSE